VLGIARALWVELRCNRTLRCPCDHRDKVQDRRGSTEAHVERVAIAIFLAVVVLLAEQVRTGGSSQDEQRWSASEIESGSDMRLDNIISILSEFSQSPTRWLARVGFYSFTAINSAQEYSHCVSVNHARGVRDRRICLVPSHTGAHD
jgi:hypothetical protein